jgi:pimeloyl-[acyl-carrier protein] methyl ester esterase
MKNIFIHGWSFNKNIWKDYFSIKNSEFLELPFHGKNINFPISENIIQHFVDKLSSKIEKSNKKINLIGWSLGASVSVLTALKVQEKINKLILIGFSPKFKDRKLGHNPVAVKAFMLALKVDFKDTIYRFRKSAVGNEFKEIPLPEKEGSIKLLNEFTGLDLRSKLKNINVSTILIHGKNDKIINYEGSVFTHSQIINSELILTESHHAPFLENKNLILDYIEK